MKQLTVIAFLICLLLPGAAAPAAEKPSGEKRAKLLIEFGWDEPDTAFMRAHAAEMDRTPFDGVGFHFKGDLAWQSWGTRRFEEKDVQAGVADLKAAAFKQLTHNFVRLNTTPAKIDWFDDHAAVFHNLSLVARAAREGGCEGILFDIEQYDGQLFDYSKQRDARTKSWDQYAAQVRLRGREAMRAFQEGYPDVTLFLTFGYSLPRQEAGGNPAKLPKTHYGLLAPFLDGMVDAAKGNTRIVDGHELSYGYKDVSRFAPAYQAMKSGVLPFVHADHDRYRQVFSFGFGVWMDHNWPKNGWNETDFSKNYYTPEAFEKTVAAALKTSDRYVWIYSETPRWWSDQGKPVKLPQAYDKALRKARGSE